MTNQNDDIVTVNCISCGAPVDLQLNYKRQEYVSI